MSKRFTNTEKWEDPWFRSLKPEEKLVFNYLCDKCNQAGFYEIDIAMASFQTGLTQEQIEGAIQGLGRGLMGAGNWVWVKNFLRHQKNLPLDPVKNNFHKHIVEAIKTQKLTFDLTLIEEYLGAERGLISPIGKGNGNIKGEGEKGVKGENPFETFTNFSESFIPEWTSWKEYKKAQHKFTYKTIDSEIAGLKTLWTEALGNEQNAIQMLNKAKASGWKGWQPIKQSNGQKSNTPGVGEHIEPGKRAGNF